MANTRSTIFDKSMVVFAIAVNMVYSRSNCSVKIAVCRNGGYEDQRYECQVIDNDNLYMNICKYIYTDMYLV